MLTNVIERKHVNECNQLRLRQNLAFSFFMYFYVRPSQSVRHAYFYRKNWCVTKGLTFSKKKLIVKSNLYHTLLQIKFIVNICVCSEIELSFKLNLSVLFFYTCPSRTVLTPYFFSPFILGKINDFRVLTTKLYFAVNFNQCYFISVNFNRGTKYRLSVRHAQSILY